MKNKYLKKSIIFILALGILYNILNIKEIYATQQEETIDYYVGQESDHERKNNKLSNVTEEMCKPEYWEDKTIINYNEEIMDYVDVTKLNQDIIDGSGTKVFDLENLIKSFDADSKRIALSNNSIPTRDLYIDGNKINNQEYFSKLNEAIKETGYTGMQESKMAVCTNRVDLKSWPIDDVIGYSVTDPDDEMESSAMNLNEAFVIFAKCIIDDNTYYWGYSNNCTGWANAKNIAICDTKEEWKNYWKVEADENNFVVVTGSRINLKKDNLGEIKIMLGTILKMVSTNNIPENLMDKIESNYIVYFAGRDDEGKAVTNYAILDKNLELNQGFLKFTQKNILKVAFSCHGDEYGWGGMNGNMDCSLYTRSIYKCFGLELPRNTTWQQKVPNYFTDISRMNDDEKAKYISTLPAGSLLYFPGHTMVFIGVDANKNFVINDLGSAADEQEGSTVEPVYSVNINSVNVKRASGKTWLNCLNGVISFSNKIDISKCEINLSEDKFIYDGQEKKPIITIKYNENDIYEGVNYEFEYINNIEIGTGKIIIKGLNNFIGTVEKSFEIGEEIKEYEFIEGKEQEIDINKDEILRFRVNMEYEDFLKNGKIYIDNEIIDKINYTVTSGSTIIKFHNEYINSLTLGEHDIKISVLDGELSTKFYVKNSRTNESKNEESNEYVSENLNKELNKELDEDLIETHEDIESDKIQEVSPKTGDNINIYVDLMLISAVGFVFTFVLIIKKLGVKIEKK